MNVDTISIKKWLLAGFHRLGIHIASVQKYRALDLRQQAGHPLAFSYRYPGRTLLIEAPAEHGIGFLNHPDTPSDEVKRAIHEAFCRPGCERALLKPALGSFYARWQPANVADYFRLTPSKCPRLEELPAWLSFWPWDQRYATQSNFMRDAAQRQGQRAVARDRFDLESRWKCSGPVSAAKLDIEVERLARLVESIRGRGFYRRDAVDGDIRVVILQHADGRWRWCVACGHHRAVVMVALGFSSLPVRIVNVIRRDEAAMWPGVVAGRFDVATALQVFDDCFVSTSNEQVTSCRAAVPLPSRFAEGVGQGCSSLDAS